MSLVRTLEEAESNLKKAIQRVKNAESFATTDGNYTLTEIQQAHNYLKKVKKELESAISAARRLDQ